MAPPPRPRPLKKDAVAAHFKSAKPIHLSESALNPRSTIAPNIRSLSWSPTGSLLAISTNANIRVWSPERPDIKASTALQDVKINAHASTVEKLAFNPRMESLLASTGQDHMVKVWDVRMPGGATGLGSSGFGRGGIAGKSGEWKAGGEVLFLTWHPDGKEILVGTRQDVVTALDVRMADTAMIDTTTTANASPPLKYELHPTDRTPAKDKGAFYQMAFTNAGKHLLATTTEGSVKLMTYPELKTIHLLSGHPSTTYSIQHSPAGNYVAVGGSDSMTTLWDTSSWFCSHVLKENPNAVRDVSFSFDGQYLACGGGMDPQREHDKGLKIWHVETGELVHTVETTMAPTFVEWHPFNYALAYAGDPNGVRVLGGLGAS